MRDLSGGLGMAFSNEDIRYRHKKRFVITPFNGNTSQCKPSGYDLSVGSISFSDGNNVRFLIRSEVGENDSNSVTIPPSTNFIVCSREKITCSRRVLCTVHARATLSAQGIVMNPVTIDPGFDGHIILFMRNVSDSEINISTSEKMFTLIFHGTVSEADGEITSNEALLRTYKKSFGDNVTEVIENYIDNWNSPENTEVHEAAVAEMRKFRSRSLWRRKLGHINHNIFGARDQHALKSFSMGSARVFLLFGLPYIAYSILFPQSLFAASFPRIEEVDNTIISATVAALITGSLWMWGRLLFTKR